MKGDVREIPQLQKALEVVTNNMALLAQVYKTHSLELMQQIQSNFQADEVLSQGSWKEFELLSLYEGMSIPNSSNALVHKMEFIFLLAQPTNILIHPTNMLGPTVLGWLSKCPFPLGDSNFWQKAKMECQA